MNANKPVAWKTNGKEVMRLDADGDIFHTGGLI